jgi:chemotaxis protein CheY-P-specific phosphatase CheC
MIMNESNPPLSRVAHHVLEDWAMMLVDPMEPNSLTSIFEDESLFRSSVFFKGPKSGTISIIAPKAFLAQLRENLLGGEEDEGGSCFLEEDGLKEMANVLAGNYLTEAFGDELVFDLMSPQIAAFPLVDLEGTIGSSELAYFLADDTPLVVVCAIQEE